MTPHTALHHKHEWRMASSITTALTPLPQTHKPDTRKWVHSLTTSSRPATIAPIICMGCVSPAALTMALDNERHGGEVACLQQDSLAAIIHSFRRQSLSIRLCGSLIELWRQTWGEAMLSISLNRFLSQTYTQHHQKDLKVILFTKKKRKKGKSKKNK